jgi:hypothetical protein
MTFKFDHRRKFGSKLFQRVHQGPKLGFLIVKKQKYLNIGRNIGKFEKYFLLFPLADIKVSKVTYVTEVKVAYPEIQS